MEPCVESPFARIAKITLVGTGFIAAGAVLTTYCPVTHRPVEWINKVLHSAGERVAKVPGLDTFTTKNPLFHNETVTEFLSLNIFETVLTAGIITVLGGILGIHQLKTGKGNGPSH